MDEGGREARTLGEHFSTSKSWAVCVCGVGGGGGAQDGLQGLLWAKRHPGGPKRLPKTAQEVPKMAHEAPTTAQEGVPGALQVVKVLAAGFTVSVEKADDSEGSVPRCGVAAVLLAATAWGRAWPVWLLGALWGDY